MKIRSVGLNFSGGKGLQKFLIDSGFTAKFFYDYTKPLGSHPENLIGLSAYIDTIDQEYDALIDLPYCFDYENQSLKYPDAKFIYIKNDIKSWVAEVKNTQKKSPHEEVVLFEPLFCNIYNNTGKDKIQDLTEKELKDIYTKHYESVTNFFKNKDNFILIDLTDPDITLKLKTFLSIDKDVIFENIKVTIQQ